jgi:hypothetical protein
MNISFFSSSFYPSILLSVAIFLGIVILTHITLNMFKIRLDFPLKLLKLLKLHTQTCRWLVRQGHCDVNRKNCFGCNASQWGAIAGDLILCRFLRDSGVTMNLLNNNGHSVLHKAAIKGNTDILRWFLAPPAPSRIQAKQREQSLECDARKRGGSGQQQQEQQQQEQQQQEQVLEQEQEQEQDQLPREDDPDWDGCGLGLDVRYQQPDDDGYTPAIFAGTNGFPEAEAVLLKAFENALKLQAEPNGKEKVERIFVEQRPVGDDELEIGSLSSTSGVAGSRTHTDAGAVPSGTGGQSKSSSRRCR